MTIRFRAKGEDREAGTNPNTKTCTVLTLQSANLGEIQCELVPDLGVDSNFNFVRLQRIGIILVEPDSAVGEWTMGVEEERAIRERKLEGGIRSVFWTMGATTRPVWVVGFVGMVGFVRVVGFVGVVGLVRMVGFVGVIGPIRMVGSVGVAGLVRVVRLMRVVGLVGMVGRRRGRRRRRRRRGMVGRFGSTRATMAVTRIFDLHRFRPMSVRVAF